MVLAEAEHVEPDLVGKLDLFDQVAQPLMRADPRPARFRADVGEGVETEFHVESSSEIAFQGRGSGCASVPASHGRVNSAYRICCIAASLRRWHAYFHACHSFWTLELGGAARM